MWEYEFEGDPNIVEVYIRRLRTRIDRALRRATRSRPSGAPGTGWRSTAAREVQTRSIRFRITALASVAVAIVLTAGGVACVLLQRNNLIDGLDEGLTQRRDDIVGS